MPSLRAIRAFFGPFNRPNVSTISRLIEKFERTGSVLDDPPFFDQLVLTKISQQCVKVWPIRQKHQFVVALNKLAFLKDLGYHAYKLVLTQELQPEDHQSRRDFVDWVLEQQAADANFL